MNQIIEQLNQDHRRLVKVLYRLDNEIKTLGGMLTGKGNMEAVVDMLDYIQTYPELNHHRLEDEICRLLKKKEWVDGDILEEVEDKHELLELLAENVHYHMDSAIKDSAINEGAANTVRFLRAVKEYIKYQLKHMEYEQKHLFPMAEKYLTEEDWQFLQILLREDYSELAESRLLKYSRIYQQLIADISPIAAT